jgi:hypothetical protein
MKNKTAKIVVGAVVAAALLMFVARVFATNQPNCEEVFTYTKSIDYADSKVVINYELSDERIDVTAQAGYQITEVALDVANDGFSGFHVYANGPVNDLNPNPGTTINNAQVKVKAVCPTPTVTPTSAPTATPTIAPTVTPVPTVEVTPTPTQEPTVTPTPTQEVTPTPTETPRITPTPTEVPQSTPSEPEQSSGNSTPSCPDLTPVKVNDIWVENPVSNDGKLTIRWGTNPSYGKAHIRYSEVDGEWRYALLNTENDGTEEIGGLKNGTHYWFQVSYVNGCMPGPYSHSFDPLP